MFHKLSPIESSFQTYHPAEHNIIPVALGPANKVIGNCMRFHGDAGMCWGTFQSHDVDTRDSSHTENLPEVRDAFTALPYFATLPQPNKENTNPPGSVAYGSYSNHKFCDLYPLNYGNTLLNAPTVLNFRHISAPYR